MPNFIELLLDNNATTTADHSKRDRTLRLNRHAALLYRQVSRQVQGKPITTQEKFYADVAEAMATRLIKELAPINLLKPKQMTAITQALHAWQPASVDPAFRPCWVIRQALLTVLPDVKKKQTLRRLCQTYKHHLQADITSQLRQYHPAVYTSYFSAQRPASMALPGSGQIPPSQSQSGPAMDRLVSNHPQGLPTGNDRLNAAIKKYAAVNTLLPTLATPQPIRSQLQQFNQRFQAQRAIIEKDRDSLTIKFIKSVTTLLSVGVAWACGIWEVKGKNAAKQMEKTLAAPSATPHYDYR